MALTHRAGDRQGSFENALDAWQMVKNSWVLTAAIVGYVFSIAFFNFFGALPAAADGACEVRLA